MAPIIIPCGERQWRWRSSSGGRGLLLLGVCLASLISFVASEPDPSALRWPELFHSQMLQNRSGELALVDLYYDWNGGRNLNAIASQLGIKGTLMDNERSNGSTYYYDLSAETCTSIDMHVGILTPDWLAGATFLGQRVVNGFMTDVWECGAAPQGYDGAFITYFAENATQRPVRWVFYDDASFDIMTWDVNMTVTENEWTIPNYCFADSMIHKKLATAHTPTPLQMLSQLQRRITQEQRRRP